jgi:polar amino acid transport system permease protein
MSWNFSIVRNHILPLLFAFLTTIQISIGSIIIGVIIGMLLGVLSVSTTKVLVWGSRIFIELFLSLPALVLLVWLYYSLPLLFPDFILSGLFCSMLGLGLSLAAFVAEIVRGGINAVPRGQIEVAYCTGMSQMETIEYILMPQVLRKSWPPLMGQFITTYKFSTLASVIAVPEVLHTANSIIAQTYRPLEIYSAIAILFVVTVIPLNVMLRRVQRVADFGGTERI